MSKRNRNDGDLDEICIRVSAGGREGDLVADTEKRDAIHRRMREVRMWKHIRLWSGYIYYLLLLVFAAPYYLSLGLIITASGLALRFWSAGYLLKNRELCRYGPYQYIRHPLYYGSFLMGAGVAVAFGNGWFLVGYLLYFITLYNLCINAEEKRLRLQFGPEFEDFQRRVHKFFWSRLLLTKKDFAGWQFRLVVRNREHRGAIFYFVLIFILFVRSRWHIF